MTFRMPVLLVGLLLMGSTGCTKSLTLKAVERFSEGLESKDASQLKLAVSNRFEERALRREEAIRDLNILDIPTGECKLVDVEEISRNQVKAKVEVGQGKSTDIVEYILTKDPRIQRWVVDDVTLKQDTGRGEVSRSVIEQMDLVMSVREFVDAWRSEDRDKILAVTSSDLRERLEPLPPIWLSQLATHVSTQTPQQKTLRPEARLNGDRAVVQVGRVMVEFQRQEDRWMMHDAAMEDEQDTIRSVRKLAGALRQTERFLAAMVARDKSQFAEIATQEFHSVVLESAQLDAFPIPVAELREHTYEARQQRDSLDLVLTGTEGAFVVSLVFQAEKGSAVPEMNVLPKVSELTIVKHGSHETQRLSAMVLAESVVQLFSEALVARDVRRLQSMSTGDFRERVWNRLKPDLVQILPMEEIENAPAEILDTTYVGATTEVTVQQGTRVLTYVLRSGHGSVEVDDVLMPVVGRPNSLKETTEQLIPVYEFMAGVAEGNIPRIQACTAESFNLIVWDQVKTVPDLGIDPVSLLALPLTGVTSSDGFTRLRFGTGTTGAEVVLARADQDLKVHDVVLIPVGGERVEMLAAMRRQLADQFGVETIHSGIQQAKAETVVPSAQRIQQTIEVP